MDVPDFGNEDNPNTDDGNAFGTAESELTTFVDVSGYVSHKRESLRAHTSQIGADSFFFSMPDEAFQIMFGTEWFIRKGATPGHKEDWLEGLGWLTD